MERASHHQERRRAHRCDLNPEVHYLWSNRGGTGRNGIFADRLHGYAGSVPKVAGRVADAFAERIRAIEENALSPFAVRSYGSRGRPEPEDECSVRTPFQRDRDRILHSKPFRRLKGKTQVFIDPAGDHYRTRMTHTLETTGIARVVARALRLNEDLTEAIGLGHDMGHPPFGHAGEAALDRLIDGGFRHNEQSARIATRLNLSHEVIDGILTHTGDREPQTLEGKIVRVVDRVAYINHDIDDAIRYGLLEERDLPRDEIEILGPTGSRRIDTLVHDLVEQSALADDIVQSDEIGAAMLSLRAFMFERVYLGPETRPEHDRAFAVISRIHDDLRARGDSTDEIVEFIAGMTDRFALSYAGE
jgi:dGTPase